VAWNSQLVVVDDRLLIEELLVCLAKDPPIVV
jgi:hypothetical protein